MNGFLGRLFPSRAKHPMLDLLRDPRKAASVRAHFAEKDAAASAPLMSEKQIERAVWRLCQDSSFFGVTSRLIESQGSCAEPALLAALSDPRFLRAKAASNHFLDDAPAVAAVRLLGDVGTARCVPRLFQLAAADDDKLVEAARSTIIKIADAVHFPEITRFFQESAEGDRKRLHIAVQNRFFERSADQPEREFFWPLVLREADPRKLTRETIQTLTAIDPGRLTDLLLQWLGVRDQSVFDAAAELLCHVDEPIDLPDVESLMGRISDAGSRAAVLKVSARSPRDPGRWETLWRAEAERQVGDSLSESIRVDTLADAVAAFLGHDSVYDAAGGEQPSDELAPAVLDVRLIRHALSQISNGGLLQFFFNSTGVTWRATAKAIERNDFGPAASIIRAAADVIGLADSDTDRPAIERRLASLNEQQEKRLRDLSEDFYRLDEELKLSIARYMLDHRETFAARSKSEM